ncbi:MAG: hypothetical protein LUD25_05410 [Coriobacteriaceae bacterium]|nr:hypothetical protein [Coriobacteriaceae bacterium]
MATEIGGNKYYPLYNNKAMFRLQAMPEDTLNAINENTEASFKLAFDVFLMLCEEGEAARKHYGYEAGTLPKWEDAEYDFGAGDISEMKSAIYAAITIGCGREIPEDADVDLTLLEAQKKTGSK